MGFFFDNYDDCLNKYSHCERSGDFIKAEKYLHKAFDKKHDDSDNSALYYLLSLIQFEQDKTDIALNNMQVSANLGNENAINFISQYYSYNDDESLLDSFIGGFVEGAIDGVLRTLFD